MSSILKALQKLEQEKAARVTREPDIHSGITRRSRPQSPQSRWILPVAMLTVAVMSITITYLLMKSERRNSAPVENGTLNVTKEQEIPAAQQTRVPPEETPPIAANTPALHPARNTGTAYPPKPQSPDGRNQTIKTTTTISQPSRSPSRESADSPVLSREQEARPKVDTSGAGQAPPALPAITINGIAWQKDNSARIAVVNGIPVNEGGTVQGTKVEEIFPDRIRFSHNGKPFEVQFGKSEQQ